MTFSDTITEPSELSENLEALRQTPIFKDIPLEIIKLHAFTARRRFFRAGDLIFRKGDSAAQAYLILSGEVILTASHDHVSVELQRLHPKRLFGYMSLLAEFDWPLTSHAVSDTTLLTMDRNHFRRIWVRYPEFCFSIVEKLVQMRMQRMSDHMQVLLKSIEDKDRVVSMMALHL